MAGPLGFEPRIPGSAGRCLVRTRLRAQQFLAPEIWAEIVNTLLKLKNSGLKMGMLIAT